jgi:tetratricopeptide (TPR) repeat protein
LKIHPSDFLLEEVLFYLDGEQQVLMRHLASCCHCRTRLGHLSGKHRARQTSARPMGVALTVRAAGLSNRPSDFDYGPAIERSERRYLERVQALNQERAEAPALISELLAVPSEKRRLLLANSSRLQTWGVYELLIERSWGLRAVRRTESEDLAKLALELSGHLDSSYYSAELIEDLRARAWAYIANLRRIAADLEGAEQAFQISYTHLKRGTREPIERAVFLDLKASLRGAQRQFHDAIRLLRRVVTIFLHAGDEHRAGKSLVNLAAIYANAGQVEDGIPLLRKALPLIDPGQDERVLLCAWHNLIDDLAMLGRFIEAQGLYRKARPLYRRNKDVDLELRRLWVKGKIERGLGQDESAEALFVEARKGFLAENFGFEAALVSLELAMLFAEQERTAELKQLAAEMLPIFTSRHIHREALAALMFFKQAMEAERLSTEVATRIAEFLRRAQGDPSLSFEASV